MKEQNEKNQEEMKKPDEKALTDEALGQVSGGVKIVKSPMGAEAAATKSYLGK